MGWGGGAVGCEAVRGRTGRWAVSPGMGWGGGRQDDAATGASGGAPLKGNSGHSKI